MLVLLGADFLNELQHHSESPAEDFIVESILSRTSQTANMVTIAPSGTTKSMVSSSHGASTPAEER